MAVSIGEPLDSQRYQKMDREEALAELFQEIQKVQARAERLRRKLEEAGSQAFAVAKRVRGLVVTLAAEGCEVWISGEREHVAAVDRLLRNFGPRGLCTYLIDKRQL